MKRPAVFLDRDGVLVRAAPHKDYAHGPLTLDEFSMFPGISEPVGRRLADSIAFDDIEVCPHTDRDACDCRKPKAGMLLAAAKKLPIDLSSSYFIGDTYRDIEAARAAGVTPILIDWPYNQDLLVRYRVRNLDEAARVILG